MSLGRLTTVFAPSSTCLEANNIWYFTTTLYSSRLPAYTELTYNYYLQGPPSTTDCLPPGYIQDARAYYSPGRCPSGYTAAVEGVRTYGSGLVETIQTCCPKVRAFTFPDARSDLQFDILLPSINLMCEMTLKTPENRMVTESNSGSTSTTMISLNSGYSIYAYAVAVRFQASDLVSSDFSVTSSSIVVFTTSAQPPSKASTSDLPTPTSPPFPTSSVSGKARRLVLGLSLGMVGIILTTAISILHLLWRREMRERRKRKRENNNTSIEETIRIPPLTEMNAIEELGEMETKTSRPEMDSNTTIYEMDPNTMIYEMEYATTKFELGSASSYRERSM